jgi:hypothetical protein
MLWADDECPELCPVRPVLAWLVASGIKKGFLFPENAFFAQNDSESKTPLHYNDFLER